MKKIENLIVLLALLSLGSCFSLGVPEVYSIFPDKGPAGTQVTISGTRFGDPKKDKVALYFGGVTTPDENIISWKSNRIVAIVPESAVTGRVVVEVNGRRSTENVVFEVLRFAPIKVSATVAVVLSDKSVRFIRSDYKKGLYIDPGAHYSFSYNAHRVTLEKLISVKNSRLLLASGWTQKDDDVTYMVYGWKNFSTPISNPIITGGLVVDAVYVNGKIYLLDSLDRSIEVLDPVAWKVINRFSVAADTPFSQPFRIFYSDATSTFVIFTKPVFRTQNGEMLIYSHSFKLEKSIPLPFMHIYNVFNLFSNTFIVTGMQDENSIYFVIPEESPDDLYSEILTFKNSSVPAAGFYPDPSGKGILVSDPGIENVLFFPFGENTGTIVINPDYGNGITIPSTIRTIPGFDYVFIKSESDKVVVIDTSIGAIYGIFRFPANIIDIEAGLEGGR